MSIRLMSLVFNYKFPKRVEYEALVYPFKRDKETKKILERSKTPEVRKLATTGSSCKAVLLALADHSNDDGKGAYPSVGTLQKKTNLERPTVIGAVLALQYHLFINFVGESPRETNNYDISPERLVKPFDQGGKASLPVKVNPVYRGGKASLPEPSVSIPKPLEDEALATISKAYESEIGLITAFIADDLKDAASTYPLKWVLDAIHEAAVQNKRGWKYCLAILKRWKLQGNQEPVKKEGANHAKRNTDTGAGKPVIQANDAASRSAAERILARRAQQANV